MCNFQPIKLDPDFALCIQNLLNKSKHKKEIEKLFMHKTQKEMTAMASEVSLPLVYIGHLFNNLYKHVKKHVKWKMGKK